MEKVNIPELMKQNRERIALRERIERERREAEKERKREELISKVGLGIMIAIAIAAVILSTIKVFDNHDEAIATCMETGMSENWCEVHY